MIDIATKTTIVMISATAFTLLVIFLLWLVSETIKRFDNLYIAIISGLATIWIIIFLVLLIAES